MTTTEQPMVLVVEDEQKIARLLVDYLDNAGYRTHWIDTGDAVDEWVRLNQPDVVLLDLMLPGKDGLTICREIRTHSQVPIVMVTARVDEIDRLLGLELGADDYICKPFSPREVVARVKAILRRIALVRAQPDNAYPGLRIDEQRFEVFLNGHALGVTPVEFRLLSRLASHPGRVFSRDQLMDKIYVDGRIVSDRTVDSHVKNLRAKILSISQDDELIRSVYGLGYKLD